MSLTLRVDLPLGRFEAGGDDPRAAEWPPHPARVHCALVAAAQTAEHTEVLRWLEQQPPPQVWAERAPLGSTVRTAFVVTNRTDPKSSSQFHPGRGNQLRRRAGSTLATSGFAIVWPDAQRDERRGRQLDDLARRVPYLGRADGTALLSVTTGAPELAPEWECFEPATETGGEVELRVPYPGYHEALQEVFLDGGAPGRSPAASGTAGHRRHTSLTPSRIPGLRCRRTRRCSPSSCHPVFGWTVCRPAWSPRRCGEP